MGHVPVWRSIVGLVGKHFFLRQIPAGFFSSWLLPLFSSVISVEVLRLVLWGLVYFFVDLIGLGGARLKLFLVVFWSSMGMSCATGEPLVIFLLFWVCMDSLGIEF